MDWGMEMRVVLFAGAAALALMLVACDAGPSASSKSAASGATTSGGQTVAVTADPRDQPVALVNGKPMWAANRKHTAQENADYQYAKNGKDFAAKTEAAYVEAAHAFADAPPPGVAKIERSNGDALLYDAKSNTFVVVAKTGAPRTMFKPRDGAAYWKQQQQRETERAAGGGDDNSQS
jgi:pyocin large subunit-like protein